MGQKYFIVSRGELDKLIETSFERGYSSGPWDNDELENDFDAAQRKCLSRPLPDFSLEVKEKKNVTLTEQDFYVACNNAVNSIKYSNEDATLLQNLVNALKRKLGL